MEDEFRAHMDMRTTIRQRRNLLSPFNELTSIFQSGPVMETGPQMVKASRVPSFLYRLKYWKRPLSSRCGRPSWTAVPNDRNDIWRCSVDTEISTMRW